MGGSFLYESQMDTLSYTAFPGSTSPPAWLSCSIGY